MAGIVSSAWAGTPTEAEAIRRAYSKEMETWTLTVRAAATPDAQRAAWQSRPDAVVAAKKMWVCLKPSLAEEWTLEGMAAQCGLGRSRFTHYCRQLTNMAPLEYLTQCRLRAAQRMLVAERGKSVTEIALAAGFNSSQYFATVFKRYFACTPRELRARDPAAQDEA